jgi:outer membrane protein assembly factor BamB
MVRTRAGRQTAAGLSLRCVLVFPGRLLAITAAAFFSFYAVATPAYAGAPGAAGDLYVSGFSSNNVVQFDGVTGAYVGEFITSAAGGLNNASGLAFGPSGNLFVCSFNGHSVREYDGSTGAFIREAIPGTFDQATGYLYWPKWLHFLPDGRLLVAGYGNDAVLVYDSTTFEWLGTWIGGQSPGGLDGPNAIAVGPNGNVFVTSGAVAGGEPGQVVEFNAASGRLERLVVTGMDSSAWGLQFAPNGNVWLVNVWGDTQTQSTGRLLQLNAETGAIVTSTSVLKPRGVILSPDGNVLVAHQGEVLEFDGATGQLIGPFASGSLSNAEGMAFKPAPADPMPTPSVMGVSATNVDACDGRVTFNVTGTNLDPAKTTVMLTAIGEPSIVGVITGGNASAVDVEFNLGAGIAGGPRDLKIVNPDGQQDTLVAALAVAPCYAARDANLFVLGYRHVQKTRPGLFEYDGETGDLIGFVIEDPTGSAGDDLWNSTGFAVGHDGNLLITSVNPPPGGSVLQYDGITGRKLGTWIPAGTGGLRRPLKLTFGPSGALYVLHRVTTGSSGGVVEFDGLTGEFSREFVPLGTCGLAQVADFEFGPNGNLYVATWNGVFEFDGQTGACIGAGPLVPEPGDPDATYRTMAFSPDGNLVLPWYYDYAGSGRVNTHDAATGALLGTPIPPPAGGIQQAHASAFGPRGHLFVAGSPDLIFQYDLGVGAVGGIFATQTNLSGIALANEIAFQPMLGDANGDWTRDLADFAAFQHCFGGEGVSPADLNCLKLDYDRDGDVDAADGAALTQRMTGPK